MKLSKRLGSYWALNLSLLPSVLAATCSELSGSTYIGPNHYKFNILCDTSTVGGHIFAYYSQGDDFQACVDRCDGDSSCIVALFISSSGDCALIDSYTSTRPFTGNDVALKEQQEVSTSASSEATSTEATTSEATSTEVTTSEPTSTEASTTEATASTEPTSTEATSTEATTSEATSTGTSTAEATVSTEATSTEATTSEAASTEATTSKATTSEAATSEATSSEDTASGLSSTSETLSASTTLSTTSQPYSSSETTSDTSTSAESITATTATTDSFSISTSNVETSTDDCDDETSSLETLATVTTSTVTGSEIQLTTLSTDSQSSSVITIQPSEPTTPASSTIVTTSSPSSLTTDSQASVSTSLPSSVTSEGGSSPPASSRTAVTETYTTYGQVASSSGSSSSTVAVGPKTLSTSGITIIKTGSESHLPTPCPTTDSVWTVYLTLVEYITCTTGVIAETVTTATYVTVHSNGGSYGPPVVTTPAGCIGGYQVDASGHSYPIAQPTKGSPGHSQPEQGNKQPSVPASAQGSQASYPDDKNSQPSAPGQGSPEPSNSEPQPAYHTGTLVSPALSSPIHQGQQGFSTTFTAEASVTEKIEAPKSTHSLGSSGAGDAPSTPASVSKANRHQGMALALVAGALLGLGMLF
ncbi:hypothetical protein FGADI_9311 [Fusarium gaditjirri]|uniref:Proteoglycan n=1 Tax=Fusarium gaditjirri TaxID=282569 RepID=A0A8H4T0I2_9HYPO|nr:hypothetical protein FGADI_9311 [Fusarium gaditjirri]